MGAETNRRRTNAWHLVLDAHHGCAARLPARLVVVKVHVVVGCEQVASFDTVRGRGVPIFLVLLPVEPVCQGVLLAPFAVQRIVIVPTYHLVAFLGEAHRMFGSLGHRFN